MSQRADAEEKSDAEYVATALRTVVVDPRGRRAKVYSRETGEVIGETDTSRVVSVLLEREGIAAELRPEVKAELRIRPCKRCGVEFAHAGKGVATYCRPCVQWARDAKCGECSVSLRGGSKNVVKRRLSTKTAPLCMRCATRRAQAAKSPEQRKAQHGRRGRGHATPRRCGAPDAGAGRGTGRAGRGPCSRVRQRHCVPHRAEPHTRRHLRGGVRALVRDGDAARGRAPPRNRASRLVGRCVAGGPMSAADAMPLLVPLVLLAGAFVGYMIGSRASNWGDP